MKKRAMAVLHKWGVHILVALFSGVETTTRLVNFTSKELR
jgi:hypothetical protein